MAKSGLYTGVDIGTNTIKVLVAEYVSGEMNIIGVGNAKSDGLKNGIIVDIEKVAQALRKAVNAAEERAGITIDRINVSIPANSLEMEPCQGMVPIVSDTKEITDNDVIQVVQNNLRMNLCHVLQNCSESITFTKTSTHITSIKSHLGCKQRVFSIGISKLLCDTRIICTTQRADRTK